MKFQQRSQLFATFLLLSLVCLFSGPLMAQDMDLTAQYQWKPVEIGAGGWMRGLAVAPTGTAAYARGDVDEVYRWSSSAGRWYPTKIFSSIPSKYTGAPVNAGGGAIAIDPSNSNHVLVVFTLSGSADLNNSWGLNVFYSTDGAMTYQAANLSLSGSLSQETTGERLVIDPNNGNVAYLGPPGAGTGNGNPDGLQRSLDGGATWTQVAGTGLPVSTASLRYEFQLPRIDGGSGTTKTGGQTASKIVYVTYIKHDETNSDNVIGGGLLKSADGGNTWTDITGTVLEAGAATVGFATIDTLGNLWIADGSNTNLYEWTRTGSTWTESNPTYGGGGGIAVDPKNPQRIFAQGNSSISRSLNGGASWTDLGPMQFASDQTISWLDPSSYRPQGHYVSVSGLYFDASGTLWIAGANDGIMNYTPSNSDTSTTWTSISEGIEEAVAEPSVIPPGGNPVLTVEDETLFSIPDPDTYTAQHFPLNTWNSNDGLSNATDSSYAPNQPRYVVELSTNLAAGNPLVQSSEYSGYSTDGGTTWQVFPSIAAGTHPCILYGGSIAVSARAAGHENDPAGADNLAWIPSNFNDFAAFGRSPAPFYSKDGGATWTQTTSFNTAPGATQRTECPSNTSYTYTGFQWGPWIFALSQHLLVADPVTPGTFYVHMTAGGFWKSTDGGVTWAQETATNAPGYPQHGTLAAVPAVSGDMWLVDGHEGATEHGLYHTLDGGNTFARSPLFDYAWALALGKAATGKTYPAIYVDGLYHGDSNWGIFQSIDGGVTFNRISNYPDGILDIPNTMAASWDVFGTVYIGFEGNTFYYGISNDTTDPLTAPVLSATAGYNVVNLSWSQASGGTPTGYSLYRGTASGQESKTAIATLDGSTFSYTDTNVTDGTAYYYTLEATSTNGQSPVTSNESSATPIPPPLAAPASLIVTPGDGQVGLMWSPVTSATSYMVSRGTTSGGESELANKITSPAYLDTTVTNGSTYYYTVTAVGASGDSLPSAEVQAQPNGSSAATGIASIGYATTVPALDGSVSQVWSNSSTYPMFHVTGTIPSGQSNSATWQALWDKNNLYLLVTVLDSVVNPSTAPGNADSVEIYLDGNDGKETQYTNFDLQYLLDYGDSSVQEFANGNPGTKTTGVVYGQAAIPGGYRIVAELPWSNLGVTPTARNLIGIDVAINNYFVAGTRTNKLFWKSAVDQDWNNPSLFGTAELEPGAALPADLLLTGGPYAIVNRNSGEDINDYTYGNAGADLHQYTVASPLSTTGQNAEFFAATDAASYYTFAESNTGGVEIGVGGSTASGTNVDVENSGTTGSTEWLPVPTDQGFFKLVNHLSGLVLDVSGSSTALGAYLIQDADAGLFSQQWQFVPLTQFPSPTFSPTPGDYSAKQTVSITSAAGGSINYTVDGTVPSATSGVAYSAPITVSSSTTVKAVAFGTGGTPSQVTSAIYRIVLAAPTGLTASVNGPGTIDLSWTAPPGSVSSYNIYRSTTSGGEGTVPLQEGVTGLTFADTSVLPGVQYYYTVAAVNSAGVGLQSSEATIPFMQAATPTFTPGSTNFTGMQSVSIATASTHAGIIYTTDGSVPSITNGAKYSGPITLTTTTTLKAISYGAGYASSAVGTATYTLIVPEPAIVLTAEAASSSEIDLSWSIASGVTVPAYNVYRGTSAGGELATPLATVTAATTYQDKSVTSGATYYYVVSALNGAVPDSNEASATATQPALSFTAATGNTSATVTAGDTANFKLTLNSTNYTGTVTYTCTGAPAADVCSVVPSSLNLTPKITTSQVIVTVQTAATTGMLQRQSSVFLSMLPLAGLLLSLPLWIKRKRPGAITVLLVMTGAFITVSGCGGSSKPAATTSTLTLTATGTGGVAPATTTLTLTVQ